MILEEAPDKNNLYVKTSTIGKACMRGQIASSFLLAMTAFIMNCGKSRCRALAVTNRRASGGATKSGSERLAG
jgi:hypothetical protein